MEPDYTLSNQDDPALREVLQANFRAHAESKGLVPDFQPLVIRLKRDGVLLGGMIARTGRKWLFIDLLSLPMTEHGSGIGSRLMAMAEAEAIRRGCVGAFLNTINFQAPGFYQKLGYEEFGRLPHDDPRLDRIWFRKSLA
ncbi:GNAT family N-acetyltransferase [Acidisphaera sp. L21]|uniref:GNAT family N-acetyltransferase n=1 Tax=Acidisphaera sp. L21 TaxID=1641851 RepID=UPI00131B7973|nr:GNAT family N-acetyltransferase [Acidisphaera sp. L21]